MINANLHKKVAVLDTAVHRSHKVSKPVQDWSVAAEVNAMFVASVEFGDIAAEYPILFVDAGTDDQGKKQVAPIAVFGLVDKENLYIDAANGNRWRAMYVPAMLRLYPFGVARVDPQRVMVVIDEGWAGWSQTEGQPLFDAEGKPTDYTNGVREQLEKIETEVQRTRMLGELLMNAKLLSDMRFEAQLPDGSKIVVDGFLTVDEKKMGELSDAQILEYHKNGVLGLIHAHQISMRHMRKLVEWRAAKLGVVPA